MLKRRTWVSALLLGLVTTACSGENPDSNSPEPSPTETTESKAVEEAPIVYASLTGDADKGKAAFARCRTCHVMDEGRNRIGPSLHNIVGAKAGSVSGFNYSAANKDSGIVWTEEVLFEYLKDPRAMVPKTKMIFGGMPDAQQRADVITYMKNPS